MKRALAMGRARLSANADDVPPAPTDGASLRILDGCSSSREYVQGFCGCAHDAIIYATSGCVSVWLCAWRS